MNKESYLATSHSDKRICMLCNKEVESHHTPFRDTVTGKIVHDYCFRTEPAAHFAARSRKAFPRVDAGPVRFA